MEKEYLKRGLKTSTVVTLVLAGLAMIIYALVTAIKGIPPIGIKEYLFSPVSGMKIWELWLLVILTTLIFGNNK